MVGLIKRFGQDRSPAGSKARRAPLLSFEFDKELFAFKYDAPALPLDTLFEFAPTIPRDSPRARRFRPDLSRSFELDRDD